MIAEVAEVLGWLVKLLPSIMGLVEAVKTGDPAQEYQANIELLRVLRLQVKAQMRADLAEAIAAKPRFLNDPQFGNEPMVDEKPWGEK